MNYFEIIRAACERVSTKKLFKVLTFFKEDDNGLFNFIQQKSPTSVSEMNVYWFSIQWGFKPRLNKVKAFGGCHRFSEEIYQAELDKIWAQIRQGAFEF
ncbi:hypothetical protein J6TS1_46410 [Siminovitchia terrae]|uniref:Uncharacterized protein n=1 Tax=Siminovitchia terrae TaxID=1914933 RepID=A0ABQ4L4E1_SIMTE|nr:hypothetical protein J6TS1_46410 [Siminovitchia terrae]